MVLHEVGDFSLNFVKRSGENAKKALQAISELKNDPRKGDQLKGSLRGVRTLKFSCPGGDYRAAYLVSNSKKVCIIFVVVPQENFYDLARRRHQAIRTIK